MIATQRCPNCTEDLPSAFWTTSAWGNVGAYCRPCKRALDAWEHARAVAIYGGRCVECGSQERLHLDHVFRDGLAHREIESAATMYRRIARLDHPLPEVDLQVLCSTHHGEKTGRERRLRVPQRPVRVTSLLDIKTRRGAAARARKDRAYLEAVLVTACLRNGGPVRLAVVAQALGIPQPPETDDDKQRVNTLAKSLNVLARDPGSPVSRPRWGMYHATADSEATAS